MIRLGHERIGFIGADWNKTSVGSAKAKGYLLAMQKHGLIPKRIPARTFLAQLEYQLSKELRHRVIYGFCVPERLYSHRAFVMGYRS